MLSAMPGELNPDAPTGTPPGPEWFQRVADHSGMVFFILRVKPDLALEFVNGGMRTQLVGNRFDDTPAGAAAMIEHIAPQSLARFDEMRTMQPGHSDWVELTWRHVTGGPVHSRGWVECRERPDGSVVIEGALQDITELRDLETGLRNSEKRHRLLAENAWDVIWTMGLDGAITYVSPAVQRVRGFTPEEAMNQNLDQIHPPESAAKVSAYFGDLFAAIANGTLPPTYRAEHEYYRKDGSIMTGELQVIPHVAADGTVVEIIGVTRDVSERKVFEAELTHMAVTDALTGLCNRRHSTALLAEELIQARRQGYPLSLLVIDLDHFKQINDTHGHPVGDEVLMEVAARLRAAVRGTDLVGRWGGEEFVVLLRHCPLGDALAAAEKLRRQIADSPFEGVRDVSVSVGATELQPNDDLASWLDRADRALYQAKRTGRNRVITA